jgi:hypothetical protein
VTAEAEAERKNLARFSLILEILALFECKFRIATCNYFRNRLINLKPACDLKFTYLAIIATSIFRLNLQSTIAHRDVVYNFNMF